MTARNVPTSRHLLAALAIGSLALAGSNGAMRAFRAQCAPFVDPAERRWGTTPSVDGRSLGRLDPDTEEIEAPEPHGQGGDRSIASGRGTVDRRIEPGAKDGAEGFSDRKRDGEAP